MGEVSGKRCVQLSVKQGENSFLAGQHLALDAQTLPEAAAWEGGDLERMQRSMTVCIAVFPVDFRQSDDYLLWC